MALLSHNFLHVKDLKKPIPNFATFRSNVKRNKKKYTPLHPKTEEAEIYEKERNKKR